MATSEQALQVTKDVYKHFIERDCPTLLNNSCVAGGAIRDAIYNKEIKDIDIFVPIKEFSHPNMESLGSQLGRLNLKLVADPNYKDNNTMVYELSGFDLPVQIILKKDCYDYADVVRNFPASVSRCYFHPQENKVVTLNSFNATKYTGKVFCTNDIKPEYLDRLKAKYKEMSFYNKTGGRI